MNLDLPPAQIGRAGAELLNSRTSRLVQLRVKGLATGPAGGRKAGIRMQGAPTTLAVCDPPARSSPLRVSKRPGKEAVRALYCLPHGRHGGAHNTPPPHPASPSPPAPHH